jgi:hypothetical protein
VITATLLISPAGVIFGVASCSNAGDVATGGGYEITDATVTGITISTSKPNLDGGGFMTWTIGGKGTRAGTISSTVIGSAYAVCLRA